MKVAFTSKGSEMDSIMDPRFGRSEYFLIYNTDNEDVIVFDNRDIIQEAHGAGPKSAQKLFEIGAKVLVTGNGPGGNALSVLEKAGIEVFVGAENMTVKEALEAYKNKQLKSF